MTWKKLFSIEGPVAAWDSFVRKVGETRVLVVNGKQAWVFQTKNVRWDLNANQLPGGVWANIGVSLEAVVDLKQENIIQVTTVDFNDSQLKVLIFTAST